MAAYRKDRDDDADRSGPFEYVCRDCLAVVSSGDIGAHNRAHLDGTELPTVASLILTRRDSFEADDDNADVTRRWTDESGFEPLTDGDDD